MVITIDGLSENGKTTSAKMLADKLGINYFNSGSIFRYISYLILTEDINLNELDELLANTRIDFLGERVLINDIDMTDELYSEEIDILSSKNANNNLLREAVRDKIRSYASEHDVVLEGRDLGARVCPDADFKFVVFASFEKRVERYMKDLDIDKKEAIKALVERDRYDMEGINFKLPEHYYEIDSTNITIDEQVDIMYKYIKGEENV